MSETNTFSAFRTLTEAYNFIPKNIKEIKDALSGFPSTDVDNTIALFTKLKRYHSEPLALQITKTKIQIKVHRSIEADISKQDLKVLSVQSGISLSFGNGSRGNTGSNNQGNAFEKNLSKDLNKFKVTRNPKADYRYPEFIKEFCVDMHDFQNARSFEVIDEGALNKKRPLKISGNTVKISNGGDIGSTVTDITVKVDNVPYYLSLKLGGTVTFFNIGVKKLFPETLMKSNEVTKDGKVLLSLFGINQKRFCEVFNTYKKTNQRSEKSIIAPRINKARLESFLRSGVGYGYVMVHAKSASSSDIHTYEMTESFSKKAMKVDSIKVHYPTNGSAKRVDVIIETPIYTLKINIRSKDGGKFPTHIMCDYKMKG